MSKQGAGGYRKGSGRPKGALGDKAVAVLQQLDDVGCNPI